MPNNTVEGKAAFRSKPLPDLAHSVNEDQRGRDSIEFRRQRRAWGIYNSRHRGLLEKRIHADVQRRKARREREILAAKVMALNSALNGLHSTPTDVSSLNLQTLLDSLDELEKVELVVEEAESDLVSSEAALSKSLPVVPGFDATKQFDFLMQSALQFPTNSSSSSSSSPVDVEPAIVLSPEHENVLTKLDEINDLEEQIIDLRDDKSRLELWPDEDLGPSQLAFLERYPDDKLRLKEELRIKQEELDNLTAIFQQSEPQEIPATTIAQDEDPGAPSNSNPDSDPPLLTESTKEADER